MDTLIDQTIPHIIALLCCLRMQLDRVSDLPQPLESSRIYLRAIIQIKADQLRQ